MPWPVESAPHAHHHATMLRMISAVRTPPGSAREDFLAVRPPGQIQVISALQIHPEFGRHSEILTKPKRRIGRHVPLPCKNLIEAVRRRL